MQKPNAIIFFKFTVESSCLKSFSKKETKIKHVTYKNPEQIFPKCSEESSYFYSHTLEHSWTSSTYWIAPRGGTKLEWRNKACHAPNTVRIFSGRIDLLTESDEYFYIGCDCETYEFKVVICYLIDVLEICSR